MKNILFILGLSLLSQSAEAQFRSLGSAGNLLTLGHPDYCSYRVAFRELYPGKGVIRVALPQSAHGRLAATSLPDSNHYRGAIDKDAVDEIADMQFLSPDQLTNLLNLDYGGGRFSSASVTLLELNSGVGIDLAVTLDDTSTTTVRLDPGIIEVEEYCTNRRFAAKLRRRSRR
jgi:hypothetical protein